MGASISQACYDSIVLATPPTGGFSFPQSSSAAFTYGFTFDKTKCQAPVPVQYVDAPATAAQTVSFALGLADCTGPVFDCFFPFFESTSPAQAVCQSRPTAATQSGLYTFGITLARANSFNTDSFAAPLTGSDKTVTFNLRIGSSLDPATSIVPIRRRQLEEAQRVAAVSAGNTFALLPDGTMCTGESVACPVGMGGWGSGWECLDIGSGLDSCGGCPSTPGWNDCTAIPFIEDVSCHHGQCIVSACEDGYEVSSDRASCVGLDELE